MHYAGAGIIYFRLKKHTEVFTITASVIKIDKQQS